MQPAAQLIHRFGAHLLPVRGLFSRRGSPVKVSRRGVRQEAMGSTELKYPEPVICNARQEQKATVFMLHGLGDTGHGWADVAQVWAADLPDVKFVFPTAPTRPITLNMGMSMPGWFDLNSLEEVDFREDKEGIEASTRYLEGLVQAEVDSGTPLQSIAVAGFSQGGCIALMMLRSKLNVSGIAGLSTFLPSSSGEVFSQENASTPVLLCHGDCDTVVAYDYGKKTNSKLQQAGVNVEFKTYKGMAHSACPEELEEIKQFLARVLQR